MKSILEDINKEVGIRGSMIVTPDGFTVAAALGPELEEEMVAAIVSSVILVIQKSLGRLEAPRGLRSCVLHASEGKIMLHHVGATFLVVVADTELNMDTSKNAIRSAIYRIQNRRVA